MTIGRRAVRGGRGCRVDAAELERSPSPAVIVTEVDQMAEKRAVPARGADRDQLWRDPEHWERFGVYRCSADARLVVRQRRAMGWTVNMGHPRAQLVLWGSVLFVLGAVAGLFALATRSLGR
jgi:uncharacterized membrane protein